MAIEHGGLDAAAIDERRRIELDVAMEIRRDASLRASGVPDRAQRARPVKLNVGSQRRPALMPVKCASHRRRRWRRCKLDMTDRVSRWLIA